MKFRIFFGLCFISLSINSVAAENNYKCKILDSAYVDSTSGTIDRKSRISRNYVGKEFVVDKATGRMIGSIVNHGSAEPKVIEYGFGERTYKVLTVFDRHGAHIDYLEIADFDHKGKQMSFLFSSSGLQILTGLCVSY